MLSVYGNVSAGWCVILYARAMDSLQDLLGKYTPKEPDEILKIKQYILETFNVRSTVGMQGESIVVTVGSGALANTLRYHMTRIQAAADTEKRIIFRIG
jgi:hypothetical protein